MNSTKYIQNAIKTESLLPENKGIEKNDSYNDIIKLLTQHVQISNNLDKIKKDIFYKNKCKLVTKTDQTLNINKRLLHGLIGIITESGEISSLLLKILNNKNGEVKEVDLYNLLEEMGDINWYQAIILDMLNKTKNKQQIDEKITNNDEYTFELLFNTNIKKLETRYPNKFKKEDALNRNTEKEYDAFR